MNIIDFTGAPGIGKSTLCRQVYETLARDGYKVVLFHGDIPGNTLLKRVYRKYLYMMIWCSPVNRNVRKAFDKMDIPSDGKHKEWMEHILLLNYQLHTQGKNYDYVLMDEGIIQSITSLYHGKRIKNQEEIDRIIKALCPEYLQNVEIIYLSLNLDEVCKRIKGRNRRGDRFLSDDEQQMKENLLQKSVNIDVTVDASKLPVLRLKCDNTSNDKLVKAIVDRCK